MGIGDRIKARRESLGIGQRELATTLQVEPNTLWRWEKGQRSPSDEDKKRIAAALGCTVSFLLGESDDPRSVASTQGEQPATGETTPITLPSGRVVEATPQQLAAYRAWEANRTVESTNTLAATLGVPVTALVPIADPDRYPTQAHRDLAALLQVMSQIDPRAGLATRSNLKIWQFTENDVRHILDVLIDTAQWKINQATDTPKKKDKE